MNHSNPKDGSLLDHELLQAVQLLADAEQLPMDAQLLGLGMTAWLRGNHWQRPDESREEVTPRCHKEDGYNKSSCHIFWLIVQHHY